LAIDKARRGKIAHSYLTDEQRSLSPKEAAKTLRYLVPEALGAIILLAVDWKDGMELRRSVRSQCVAPTELRSPIGGHVANNIVGPLGLQLRGDEVLMAIAWMGHKAGLAF